MIYRSAGSGGVFGPGMVIGGFLGGAIWSGLHAWAPWMLGNTPPGAFAVVGMGAFFGGVGKAPLAVILMVAEMTGGVLADRAGDAGDHGGLSHHGGD